MTFEEDLTKRRINVAAFAAGDPERYAAWRMLYEQVHPNTFYTSVKMVINEVRRQFWLAEVPKPAVATAPAAAKSVVRRATGTVPSTASAIPDEPSLSVDRTPEPAPRTRPVIRKPTAPPATASDETKPEPQTPVTATEKEVSNPETPKPGRARPVFKRPTTEPTNAADDSKPIPQTEPPVNPATTSPTVQPAKPPRPRPVFRKPTAPENDTTNPHTAEQSPAETKATSLPEPSNVNPAETPKPPRPRPVFKRPASATTPEPEQTAATPEAPVNPVTDSVSTPEENPVEAIPDAPKPPRPRPVFKRPISTATTEPAKEPSAEPEGLVENNSTEVQPEKTTELSPEPVKPPRPRPIFKRPGTTAPAQNAAEPTPEPSVDNTAESALVPDTPKFPRPRPVMKRPVASPESPTPEPAPESLPEARQPDQEVKNLKKDAPEPADTEAGSLVTPAEDVPEVPVPPKTPRPRPIFKRPTKPDAPENTNSNIPSPE
ncbi:hypothetical protein HUW51_04900 [Adhaeribacter swui]|uniref:Uncharacterized protein n=1 Tax=Adhaeribacter swui TaxID=2086471 RepID=A0A7G7G4L4_9BACT|nr:hypothetical protein [Adhaeribacter swui]QNF32098.1 hypothetical protein HUW51_04900 [Adhaeribacter swui]